MKPRLPEKVNSAVVFQAFPTYVVAVFSVGTSTIGIRFESPYQLLSFFNEMMEKASVTWPEDKWVKEWKRPE